MPVCILYCVLTPLQLLICVSDVMFYEMIGNGMSCTCHCSVNSPTRVLSENCCNTISATINFWNTKEEEVLSKSVKSIQFYVAQLNKVK